MFKRILIPTDGSKTAAIAVRKGIKLAKELGATVTGYYAVESALPAVYGEGYGTNPHTLRQSEARAQRLGESFVAEIGKAAKAAGVPFEHVVERADVPYRGIVDAAKKHKCDAIFMASNGRTGVSELLLGSVTHKVLAHSKIPVLVYR